MPQQLSSLELSPRRDSLESLILSHLMAPFCPSGKKQKELKRQKIKDEETRSSEELERGHRRENTVSGNLHYQRTQRITNPQMVLDSGERTVKATASPSGACPALRLQQSCLPNKRAGLGCTTHRGRQRQAKNSLKMRPLLCFFLLNGT